MQVSGESQGNETRITISFDNTVQETLFQKMFLDMLKEFATKLDGDVYDVNGNEIKDHQQAYTTPEVNKAMKSFGSWLKI